MSNQVAPSITFAQLSSQEALTRLQSDLAGLTEDQISRRLVEFGPNKLPEPNLAAGVVKLFFRQFTNIMVGLMAFAATLSIVFGHGFDALLIAGIILINAVMGFVQEFKAEKSVNALKKMLTSSIRVRRMGEVDEVSQDSIVPGDIILLSEGNKVPADARLISVKQLELVESALTGESMPVLKKTEVVTGTPNIGDLRNMVWMGTTVSSGTAEAVVVATGSKTVFGQIAQRLSSMNQEKSHFHQKVSTLTKQMGGIAVGTAVIAFIIGYFLRDIPFTDISLFTVATLIAALPEGLPIVLVVVLAVGAQRMAKNNAIVRRLDATETLGVVSVIITDKTGTLTQNIMTAKSIVMADGTLLNIDDAGQEIRFHSDNSKLNVEERLDLKKLLQIAGSCNGVVVKSRQKIAFENLLGDPTERGMFLLAHRYWGEHAPHHLPSKIADMPFQQDLKLRACLSQHQQNNELIAVGAPEYLIEYCHSYLDENGHSQVLTPSKRDQIVRQLESITAQGMRSVACAFGQAQPDQTDLDRVHLEQSKLTFVGIVGLHDPPRPEVTAALEQTRVAGIRVIMATGDHPVTAVSIAQQIGLVDDKIALHDVPVLTNAQLETMSDAQLSDALQQTSIFARLTPESKLRIAAILQSQGHVIAMTGDGVNDAPALKKADVGISMGLSGTDVAREASKIVLADDNFASIVKAIREGRTQFDNLRRTSYFLVITNVAQSIVLLTTLFLGFPLALLPMQILWLNIVTGGLTDFALALEPSHEESMNAPPKNPSEQILTRTLFGLFLAITASITLVSLVAFFLFYTQGIEKARTAVFVVLSLSQLINLFSLRSFKKSVFQLGITTNKPLLWIFGISVTLLLAALYWPFMANLFQFQPIAVTELVFLVVISLSIFISSEAFKAIRQKRKHHRLQLPVQGADGGSYTLGTGRNS